jgi:hypothetical protein
VAHRSPPGRDGRAPQNSWSLMSGADYGLTPDQWTQLETSARLWFFDGVPTDPAQLQQLLVYARLDGDIAELHSEILAAKAQALDDYLDAFCRTVERFANGQDTL